MNWERSASNGGSPIIGYKVHIFQDGSEIVSSSNLDNEADNWAYTFNDLIGEEVTVYVSSFNALGSSAFSVGVTLTPRVWFQPLDLPLYNLDIDPGLSNSVTLDDEDRVVEIADYSWEGGYNATQPTEASRPVIRTEELNGKDVLYCAPGKSLTIPADFLSTWDANNKGSLYFVLRYRDLRTLTAIIDTANRHLSMFIVGYTGQMNYYGWGGASNAWPGGDPPNFLANNWVIGSLVMDGTNARLYSYGKGGGAVPQGTTFSDAIPLGDNPSGGNDPDIDYARIVGYGGVQHTTEERQKIEGYLAHEYALTAGLDAGHPYKTNRPLL